MKTHLLLGIIGTMLFVLFCNIILYFLFYKIPTHRCGFKDGDHVIIDNRFSGVIIPTGRAWEDDHSVAVEYIDSQGKLRREYIDCSFLIKK